MVVPTSGVKIVKLLLSVSSVFIYFDLFLSVLSVLPVSVSH